MNNLTKTDQKKRRNPNFRPGNGSDKYIEKDSPKPLVEQLGTDIVKPSRKKLKQSNGKSMPVVKQDKADKKETKSIRRITSPLKSNTLEVKQEEIPVSKEIETSPNFDNFSFDESIIKAIKEVGYASPTLIQDQAITPILARKDVLGIAKTGSGKTAAYALPVLNNLVTQDQRRKQQPKVLVVSPTRELAIQIGESFTTYGKYTGIKQITVYGGVAQGPQVRDVRRGADILVATPGRLLDLINQKVIKLDFIQTLIIDEADRMFDMGFIPDIKRIVNLIPDREQTLLFSATMPSEILDLARKFLKQNFTHVTGDLQTVPIKNIQQEIFFVEQNNKLDLLINMLESGDIDRALIFSRTKYGADKLARKLSRSSFTIEAMHGNKSQQNRQRTLNNFKNNRTQILVATDLAARGLDVDDISHVINYDLPSEPETYMHRIGRTARAGKSGIAISFCAVEERKYITRVEQLMGFHIPRATENPWQSSHDEPAFTKLHGSGSNGRSSSNGRNTFRRNNPNQNQSRQSIRSGDQRRRYTKRTS